VPGIVYPSVEELIETNKRVLREIRAKRADRHHVLSRPSLEATLRQVKLEGNDLYEKAAILLTQLVRSHAFASGVRRTAYVASISFLRANGEHPSVIHDSKILTGIREGFYTMDEVVNWLRGNVVRKFVRP